MSVFEKNYVLDICVKESCFNAGDLLRCIDGAELKEFVMQWFALAGEILMHSVCYTLGCSSPTKNGSEFSFNEALIWRSAVKLKIDGPSGKWCTPHFMACKSKNPALLLRLHCIVYQMAKSDFY